MENNQSESKNKQNDPIMAEKLRWLKKLFELTNDELGSKVGVSGQAINQTINNRGKAPQSLLYALARMGVDINLFVDSSVSVDEFAKRWNYKKNVEETDSLRLTIAEQSKTIKALSVVRV